MGALFGQQKDFVFQYTLEFEDGTTKQFVLNLDGISLDLTNAPPADPPEWTRLGFSQCQNCPLERQPHCPIALNLSGFIPQFEDTQSFTTAKVTLTTYQRTYVKQTTVQTALSAMIGIIMVTSGCPVMDKLRPNVAFHLPFASIIETAYRSVAMYLTAQAIRKLRGKEPDWEMTGLMHIYEDISHVNKGMAHRVKQATTTDSGANAIVILNAFGDSVSIMVETQLEELEGYFRKLLENDGEDAREG